MTTRIHPQAPPRDDTELAALLRERGLRATSQRVVMHRLLRDRNRHLSAEELLSEASERLPGVSPPPSTRRWSSSNSWASSRG